MKCPYCRNLNSRVIDSRLTPSEFSIRRRRECQKCLRRFTTYEKVEELPVVIIKKDGRREDFSREKILAGIAKACEKRAISVDQLEEIVDLIERDFREKNDKEVFSRVVGEKIMTLLHDLDDVAYVRFASVYREFKDVADFIDELKSLEPMKKKEFKLSETQEVSMKKKAMEQSESQEVPIKKNQKEEKKTLENFDE